MKKETKSVEKDVTEVTSNESQHETTPEQTHDEEINYDLICSGPLYYDLRNIRPGYVPLFVADRPGEIEKYKRLGYQIVLDEFSVGQDTASKSSKFGSAITVQSKCGALLVLMSIRQDLYDKYEAYKAKNNEKRMAFLKDGENEGVPKENQHVNGIPIGYYKES